MVSVSHNVMITSMLSAPTPLWFVNPATTAVRNAMEVITLNARNAKMAMSSLNSIHVIRNKNMLNQHAQN